MNWFLALAALGIATGWAFEAHNDQTKIAALTKQLKVASAEEETTQAQLADASRRADQMGKAYTVAVEQWNACSQNADAQERIASAAEDSASAQQDIAFWTEMNSPP